MTRLFVGIELPDDVKATLLRLETGIPGARWQTSDQLHLTVRFVGDVDGPTAEDVASALDTIEEPGFESPGFEDSGGDSGTGGSGEDSRTGE